MSIKLYHGDCLEIMPTLAAKSIDMIFSDIPYGTTRNKWDRALPLDKLWAEYERIIKDNGAILLFSQTPFDKILAMSNLKRLKYEWIWEKSQGSGHLNAKKMPLKKHENILVFYKSLPTYNPQMTEGKPYTCKNGKGSSSYDIQKQVVTVCNGLRYPSSVLRFASEKGYHATQKPVSLCEYLIKTYTNEDETILDSCMGSGSIGIAARNCNRNFIGIEQDEKYFDIAKRRVNGGE